jgi:hypothetical protein
MKTRENYEMGTPLMISYYRNKAGKSRLTPDFVVFYAT